MNGEFLLIVNERYETYSILNLMLSVVFAFHHVQIVYG